VSESTTKVKEDQLGGKLVKVNVLLTCNNVIKSIKNTRTGNNACGLWAFAVAPNF
jgi:hypothetical protein